MAQQDIYIHPKSESFLSKTIKFVASAAGASKNLGKQLAKENLKNDAAPISKAARQKCAVKEETFRGEKLWTLSPKEGPSKKSIFYIHGGGYVLNMSGMQWNYLAQIVATTKSTIMVANYPLAPQSNAQEAFDYLQELYPIFLEREKGKEVLFLGDSAGAGLTISFAQHLNEIELPQPTKIILSSPWLDVSLTNPDIKNVIPKDKVLEITSLQKAGKIWAGKWDTKDPRVSPIYGRFDNIAKIYMFMGTAEIFVSDAKKLVKKLQEEKVPIAYYEYPKMLHCWLLIPMPEAKVAMNQIMTIVES